MAWPPFLQPKPSSPHNAFFQTLSYSNKFDYPLTLREIWFWQIRSSFSEKVFKRWPYSTAGLYYLKGKDDLVKIRKYRSLYSHKKWIIARKYTRLLSRLPTVLAIFVTGSLAMNNSPRYDDIDILIVSRANTLWITRFLTVLLLSLAHARRRPRLLRHSSPAVSDKICDNLYLDLDHLAISHRLWASGQNLYLAHEILQAKCVFDRGEVNRKFLTQNSWVKPYLPVAYTETMKQFNHEIIKQSKPNFFANIFLFTINYLLFTVQYLYTRKHLTRERVGLGFAFFHPRSYGMI